MSRNILGRSLQFILLACLLLMGAWLTLHPAHSDTTRESLLQEGGGNTQSEAAVASGLSWLNLHQAPDGHWSINAFPRDGRKKTASGESVAEPCDCTGTGSMENDVAGTALGLLPMLGAGQTHHGTGGRNGRYTRNVERGLKYLEQKQQANGELHADLTAHALAALALCEAYGLTSDPMVRGPAQRALTYIVKAQQPDGGWRAGHDGKSDTLTSAWQLMALTSGQMAGLNVPTESLRGVTRFLDSVESPDHSRAGKQGPPGERPASNPPEAASAAALLCREYLGWGPRHPSLPKGVEQLLKAPPSASVKNMTYLFFATQVLFHIGGEPWASWNPRVRDLLISTQDKGGDAKHVHQKGSWSPQGDARGADGGRLMTTSLALLSLEVYYRHLPLYRREIGAKEPNAPVEPVPSPVVPGPLPAIETPVGTGGGFDGRSGATEEKLERRNGGWSSVRDQQKSQGLRIPGGKANHGEGRGDKYGEGPGPGGGPGPHASEADKPDSAPQTWRRDGRQPAFARVYVGGGNSLDLVSLQVSVTIEGPRARTLVDHIFYNPHDRQLEGTFEYPLPTGASPSYFAMFLGQTRAGLPARFGREGNQPLLPAQALARMTPAELVKHVNTADWGVLQEARVVAREKALETYEEIVRGRVDPALLEYAGGNTFSGRVFPIPSRGYNRVLIAYEELLPVSQGQVFYRFPLPGRKLAEMQFTLQASASECKAPLFNLKESKKEEGGGRLVYTRSWKEEKPEGAAIYSFTPVHPQVQTCSGRQGENGPLYLYARLRPELKTVDNERPFADHALFLLDTSLSEHPDRFAVNMKLLRKVLESDPAIKHFNILIFNVGTAWVEPRGWLANTAAGRDQALARLDGLVLEGATDLAAALDQLVHPGWEISSATPLNVFLLSDGQITWGESEVASLVARFESRCPFPVRFHCYRTGLGAENLELFEALTRTGGGIFNCFTEADLPAAAVAHRKQCFQIEHMSLVGGPTSSDLVIAGRKAAIYPGGELLVAARLDKPGRTNLVLEGTFLGKRHVEEFPLEVTTGGELAARAWGEMAVASLLALNDPKLENLVTAYCQQFGIGSRVASFLVLENNDLYKRFNLEEERGRTITGDLGLFLQQTWHSLGKVVSAREAFQRFLARVDPQVKLTSGPEGAHVTRLLALLTDKDFDLPPAPIAGALVHKADVPPTYLSDRDRDERSVATYLVEARRRLNNHDAAGAIRVLTSVVEEYPDRADALRLVGYRLLDLAQAAQAVRLFEQVQHRRPFEPHSYRDLARSLEESGRFGLAAVQYEILLAGTWHNRFRDSLKLVAQEEYARMMQEAIRRHAVPKELADHFGERLERMTSPQPHSDLRVTISWNTDATDVDLWVIEPDGTKCFYGHNRTDHGGELSQDQTQGYGPERYQIQKAQPGVYTVIVHYFRADANLLAGETHVNVMVTQHAGSPTEVVQRHTVILTHQNEQVEVARVKY